MRWEGLRIESEANTDRAYPLERQLDVRSQSWLYK